MKLVSRMSTPLLQLYNSLMQSWESHVKNVVSYKTWVLDHIYIWFMVHFLCPNSSVCNWMMLVLTGWCPKRSCQSGSWWMASTEDWVNESVCKHAIIFILCCHFVYFHICIVLPWKYSLWQCATICSIDCMLYAFTVAS